ncbi:hypothetical protein [Achromobacter spanius]
MDALIYQRGETEHMNCLVNARSDGDLAVKLTKANLSKAYEISLNEGT